MTETYEPPTTHVIPAKAGIYLAASKFPKRRPLSRRRQNSTQYDRVQRTTTKTRACACTRARAREAEATEFLSLGMDCAQVTEDSTYHLASPPPKHHANTSNETSTRMACARHAGNTMVEGAMRLRSRWFPSLTRNEPREGRRAAADRSASGLPTRIPGFPKRRWPRRVLLDLGFVLRPQATRTDVETARLSILVDGSLVHVRKPSGVGTPLRVADVVTGHTSLAANLTLCHNLFDRLSRIEYTCGTS